MSNIEKAPVNSITLAVEQVNAVIEDVQENYMSNDANEAIASMALPILTATSFEEMFLGAGTEPDKELFDVNLNLQEVTFQKSTYEEADGFPFYVVLKGKRIDDGTDFLTVCGAWQVVLVCYRMVKENWLPRNVRLHRSERETARGYRPINLLPSDAF